MTLPHLFQNSHDGLHGTGRTQADPGGKRMRRMQEQAKSHPATEERQLLRIESDVRRITGLGRTRVRQGEIEEGRPPVVRVGRAVRVDSRDLDAWIERSKSGNGVAA